MPPVGPRGPFFMRYIPPAYRLQGTDVSTLAVWGGTGGLFALWLIQASYLCRSLCSHKLLHQYMVQVEGYKEVHESQVECDSYPFS